MCAVVGWDAIKSVILYIHRGANGREEEGERRLVSCFVPGTGTGTDAFGVAGSSRCAWFHRGSCSKRQGLMASCTTAVELMLILMLILPPVSSSSWTWEV